MAKNVISQSDELIKLRSKLLRENVLLAVGIGLIVILCWLIYVLFSALGYGHIGWSGPFGSVAAFKWAKYFDMNEHLFPLSSSSQGWRLGVILLVLLLASGVSFLFAYLHMRKINAFYQDKYLHALLDEVKFNGVALDIKKEVTSQEEELGLLNLSEVKPLSGLTFSTPLLSWEGRSYSYLRDNKPREGLLITTDLSKAKTHAFIQLRTFGQPNMKQYEGLPIKAYGFGDEEMLSDFVCYTTLGADIYLVLDKKTAQALNDFYGFVKCDIAVTIIGSSLTVFLDGFSLQLTHDIRKKIPSTILEQEAEALTAIHQAISNFSMALSGEVGFAKEEKGDGILPY